MGVKVYFCIHSSKASKLKKSSGKNFINATISAGCNDKVRDEEAISANWFDIDLIVNNIISFLPFEDCFDVFGRINKTFRRYALKSLVYGYDLEKGNSFKLIFLRFLSLYASKYYPESLDLNSLNSLCSSLLVFPSCSKYKPNLLLKKINSFFELKSPPRVSRSLWSLSANDSRQRDWLLSGKRSYTGEVVKSFSGIFFNSFCIVLGYLVSQIANIFVSGSDISFGSIAREMVCSSLIFVTSVVIQYSVSYCIFSQQLSLGEFILPLSKYDVEGFLLELAGDMLSVINNDTGLVYFNREYLLRAFLNRSSWGNDDKLKNKLLKYSDELENKNICNYLS